MAMGSSCLETKRWQVGKADASLGSTQRRTQAGKTGNKMGRRFRDYAREHGQKWETWVEDNSAWRTEEAGFAERATVRGGGDPYGGLWFRMGICGFVVGICGFVEDFVVSYRDLWFRQLFFSDFCFFFPDFWFFFLTFGFFF